MLLITILALSFEPCRAKLEHGMIEFAGIMKKMVNDEKIIQ